MKKTILLFGSALLMMFSINIYATSYTITTSGFMFTPDSIVINLGDTIVFNATPNHPVVEVEQSTWTNNQNTPKSGGFSFTNGSGTFASIAAGTYFYVCNFHFASGMKGRIFVNPPAGIENEKTTPVVSFSISPNPVTENINISYAVSSFSKVKIAMYDVLGKEVVVLADENQNAGNYNRQFAVRNDLKAGLYFVKISIGNNQSVQKVVVQ